MSRPDYPTTPTQAEHEHEHHLAIRRKEWHADRERILGELDYARRTVAALETMLNGVDAALSASQPMGLVAGTAFGRLDGRNGYGDKSYEIGSGEKYPR